MIFITLGTQKFQFDRLLKKIDELIEDKVIHEDVFAQTGYSEYVPCRYNYRKFMDRDEFADIEEKADLIITHGGTGAIIGALKKGKKVIAVPRMKKYCEHVDDHQIEIVKQFGDMGLILPCYDVENLNECYGRVKQLKAKKYISNTASIIHDIDAYLDSL